MIHEVEDTGAAALASYDAIIDVRSPAEYEEDHIPGAINLPVLDNAERAEVGTAYKQDSTFRARAIGAAYVSRNIAGHLEHYFADKPPSFHPLVYCWRGGMRSNSLATILSRIGWRTDVLQNGYKNWRRSVVAFLRDSRAPLNIVLLDGQTGTAKTEILQRLRKLGVQIVDLEGMAEHKGSVFGEMPGQPQPAQKLFETRLYDVIRRLDPFRPIVVEAESNRIGRCEIPKRIWSQMLPAPRIVLEAPIKDRTRYLLQAYAPIIEDKEKVLSAIGKLKPFHEKEMIEEWIGLAERGDYSRLAEALMREHYDPLYARSRKRLADASMTGMALGALDDAALDQAAREICNLLEDDDFSRGITHRKIPLDAVE